MAANQEPEYWGAPGPVWRTWCDLVLEAITLVRLGVLDRQEAYSALHDWASRWFETEAPPDGCASLH